MPTEKSEYGGKSTLLGSLVQPRQLLTELAPKVFDRKLLHPERLSQLPRPSPTQLINLSSSGSSRLRGISLANARNIDVNSLYVLQGTAGLLSLEVPEEESKIGLFEGFEATRLEASRGKEERRKKRALLAESPGGGELSGSDKDGPALAGATSTTAAATSTTNKTSRRRTFAAMSEIRAAAPPAETQADLESVGRDLANIAVRRELATAEIASLDRHIAHLSAVRAEYEQSLLHLREEEIELEDERDALAARLAPDVLAFAAARGPALLPSQHDTRPKRTAFMDLPAPGPIAALDFTEPYGLAVAAAGSAVHVWDLTTAEPLLAAPQSAPVSCLQVNDATVVTGAADGAVRVCDLDSLDARDGWERAVLAGHSKAVTALHFDEKALVTGSDDCTMRHWDLETGQCVLTMDVLWAGGGWGGKVERRLSTGRLRGHPTTTGLSHTSLSASVSLPSGGYASFQSPSSSMYLDPLSASTPSLNGAAYDTSYDNTLYDSAPPMNGSALHLDTQDSAETPKIGALQFWGFALASGTADGCLRLWDTRTGQVHRTLIGHTDAITSLQFDDHDVMSGSRDRTIRIWDLRMGLTTDTLKYEHGVTAFQFDRRRIVTAAGASAAYLYNRTTQYTAELTANGHSAPVTRLRFADSYLATGGEDNVVKLWAL